MRVGIQTGYANPGWGEASHLINYFSCFVFQVQLLLDIENSLPLFILKRFQVHSYSECPNGPKSIRTKVSYKLFLMIAFRGSRFKNRDSAVLCLRFAILIVSTAVKQIYNLTYFYFPKVKRGEGVGRYQRSKLEGAGEIVQFPCNLERCFLLSQKVSQLQFYCCKQKILNGLNGVSDCDAFKHKLGLPLRPTFISRVS